ncbi:M13 family metallopeptidase [Aurantivibrio infirmus]
MFTTKRVLLALPLTAFLCIACDNSSEPEDSANTPVEMSAATAPQISGVRLDFMDTSVSPAEDFFRYANGGWMASTEIPADKSRYGAFTMLADKSREDVREIVQQAGNTQAAKVKGSEAQQIGDFYASYLDTATINSLGVSPLKPYFDEISDISTYSELSAYFAKANSLGSRTPLGFYIDTDEKDPSSYMTYFYQSGLGLPDRDYYLKDDEESASLQNDYRAHIAKMFELADLENGEDAAKKIYAIEYAIAEKHWPRAELRDRDKTYNKRSQADLAALGDTLQWAAYLDSAGLSKADSVVLSALSYFESLDALVEQFSVEDWQTYLKWHALTSKASRLAQALDEEDFNFYGKRLSGVEQQEERWKRAINTLNGQLGDAIGKLYVEKHFSAAAKTRMEELVENLREAYRESIIALEWMGDETKLKAIDKLEKFNPKIGYPNKWRDLSSLEIKADDLFGNAQRADAFHYQIQIDKLGKPVDRDEWFMNPQTVNAYYNPGMNEIVFPAAILQPPFFNMEADDAINYGAIGAVIGHEMGHGFDDQGAKSNGDGLLENWWTESDLQEFESRTDKLVEQYNGYTVLGDLAINGELTQGENIGDLGGLTIAHKAYLLSLEGKEDQTLDGLSGEQRFFLGWGQVWANKYRDEELRRRILTDPHSPPLYRVNGVLPNMPEFHNAFGVKEGDDMFLAEEDRVKIW